MKPSARVSPAVRSAIRAAGGCWASMAGANSAATNRIVEVTRRMVVSCEKLVPPTCPAEAFAEAEASAKAGWILRHVVSDAIMGRILARAPQR